LERLKNRIQELGVRRKSAVLLNAAKAGLPQRTQRGQLKAAPQSEAKDKQKQI
jgi:hypothetical protein